MNKQLDIHDYLDIGVRRKWWFIVPFVLVLVLTAGYLYKAPKVYRASTLILVEPQQVPSTYVQPTVTERVEDRVRTMNEQVTSRSFLEKIIGEFDLYPDIRRQAPMEAVVDAMRKNIDVQLMERSQIFTISFQHKDPTASAKVANRLASLFIDENLKAREDVAEGTLVFLDKEIERVRAVLKEQEKQVSDFRTKNLGILPEQLDANLRTLDRLQSQLADTQEAIKRAEESKRELHQQQLLQQALTAPSQEAPQTQTQGQEANDPVALRDRLAQLRLKYTDQHPEVIALKGRIADLEKMKAFPDSREGLPNEEQDASLSEPPAMGPVARQARRIDMDIAQMKNEANRLRATIKDYERRVDITPKVEEQLKEITRGYAVTQDEYQSLLEKRLQAELAANMERKQKGERFKIIDQAKIPERPFKPDPQRVLLFGLMVALAAGGGLAVLIEYLDTSFYKAEELSQFAQLPVLVSIPDIRAEKKRTPLRKK